MTAAEDRLADAAGAHRVVVDLPGAAYEVTVGPGLLASLDRHLRVPNGATRAALVTCAPVQAHYGDRVVAALEQCGLRVEVVVVPDGEGAKSLGTLESVYHRLAAMPLHRSDVVVALGGGVVGDLAGFAAATWHRGVGVVQLPTTLLAQVDAAVGGKTGVNLPEGKNLVGAFHQPLAVLADTTTLGTLPLRERRAGLGEVAKYGFIADPVVLDLLEERPGDATAGEPELLSDLVRRSVEVKGRIVARDEREAGDRMLLNYGHTVGHAIEALTEYETYRHGEAVALGMVFAARLGERLGVSESGLGDRTVALLEALGLPTGGLRLDPAAVWEAVQRDKKVRGARGGTATVRFVLCRSPGDPLVVDAPERGTVEQVLRTLA